MILTEAEENYLKCIHKLSQHDDPVSTTAVSHSINTTAASVTDMIKRLAEKGLLNYVKYRGVSLTEEGNTLAVTLIRKHRLWEVFLVEKLQMKWDEVHEIAEQLEHIRSPLLIERLDDFLDYPRFDPHGDPIPDRHGKYSKRTEIMVSEMETGQKGILVGVKDHSAEFLQYLTEHKLTLGAPIELVRRNNYDSSVVLQLSSEDKLSISQQVAKNLYISPLKA